MVQIFKYADANKQNDKMCNRELLIIKFKTKRKQKPSGVC